jgi:hypothetical protein
MEGLIKTFFYQTSLFTYDMAKRHENNTYPSLDSRRESRILTARALSCLRWRGSFYELTCKINLFTTADSILMFFFFFYHSVDLFHLPTLKHNFYSLTICMLHYSPRHISSMNMPIFRRTNCILYSHLQRVTIPDAVIIQFVLLKMGMFMLETCRGL